MTIKAEREVWGNADAVSFILGASDEEVVYTKSSSIQIWLFGYEFTQTIVLLCAKNIFVLTSPKKGLIAGCLLLMSFSENFGTYHKRK